MTNDSKHNWLSWPKLSNTIINESSLCAAMSAPSQTLSNPWLAKVYLNLEDETWCVPIVSPVHERKKVAESGIARYCPVLSEVLTE